ncbi:MAG: cysteine peptidase family C39 domain-containing protein [Anaerolineae bacterium]
MLTILPVPHILQTRQADCLAACAAMVLSHLNKPLPYADLLTLLNIQWFGAPFSNIRALEQMDVHILYQQGILDDLSNHLAGGQPIITPVFTGELPYTNEATNHAVVVVGMGEHYVYINDPAVAEAPIPVPKGDFELAWMERNEWYAVIRI